MFSNPIRASLAQLRIPAGLFESFFMRKQKIFDKNSLSNE
jgi:hypothetical protein